MNFGNLEDYYWERRRGRSCHCHWVLYAVPQERTTIMFKQSNGRGVELGVDGSGRNN